MAIDSPKEYLKTPRRATSVEDGVSEIAERLLGELPEQCRGCNLAEALGCTIVAGEWWLPQTPRAARFSISTEYGGYTLAREAEYALRTVVKSANESDNPGPKGDGTVCCIDTRDIQSARYTD
ncbi:MAG: hypothetical protein H6799_02780 [Candidatus Nomurabacteria bacterium]|nr:MAG: hypothetical protein H6799_02780 [Candidatus Nomurabacteria bacterium]